MGTSCSDLCLVRGHPLGGSLNGWRLRSDMFLGLARQAWTLVCHDILEPRQFILASWIESERQSEKERNTQRTEGKERGERRER